MREVGIKGGHTVQQSNLSSHTMRGSFY